MEVKHGTSAFLNMSKKHKDRERPWAGSLLVNQASLAGAQRLKENTVERKEQENAITWQLWGQEKILDLFWE